MYAENQRIIPTLAVSAVIGMLLWGFVPGAVDLLLSIDFGATAPGVADLPLRLMAFLWIVGAFIGVACQALAILGGYLRSRALILFAPMLVGIAIGVTQAYLIGTPLLGFEELGFSFRPPPLRMLLGGICGLVAVPPLMVASARVRQWMP
jgi:hypothetical protein